ncbi:MAG TPA: hypothetical protein VJA26_00055 [Gammaproteobacteria bacterium]|nr:hypothetical protein [Gammaproteobacteria bacterium]
MNGPKHNVQGQPPPVPELDSDEITQEITAPLADLLNRRDEPTLSQVDFDEIELALDS